VLDQLADDDSDFSMEDIRVDVPIPALTCIGSKPSSFSLAVRLVMFKGSLTNIFLWAPHGSQASYSVRSEESFARGCALVSLELR